MVLVARVLLGPGIDLWMDCCSRDPEEGECECDEYCYLVDVGRFGDF